MKNIILLIELLLWTIKSGEESKEELLERVEKIKQSIEDL